MSIKSKILPALYGGKKLINYKFRKYNSIGNEEQVAASKVIKSGNLSGFTAGQDKNFYGGVYVKKFERYLKKFYGVKYAITLNSWTSGLIASIGALDIEPGDEIITTPWTMCACATAILHWNAIPVFADIDDKTFCISPDSIKKKITKRTKAILAVDIFGISSDIKGIKKVIKKKNITLISDSAQTPYFFHEKKLAGTHSDIGGFSLNCHKHINTGEGGIVVTNNTKLASRVFKLRNHAEAAVKKNNKINNMIGYNFRMGEIEAAIGLSQYKKLKKIIVFRNNLLNYLAREINKLEGINVTTFDKKLNNYYVFPIVLDLKKIKISRKKLINLLKAEGITGLNEGYANIHQLPLFQKKIAYGKNSFPWTLNKNIINYKKGSCPVAEYLHEKSFIGFEVCLYSLNKKDIINISSSFKKIWKYLNI